MAKRRAKAGTRKPGRKTRLRAKGATAKQARKATRSRKTPKPKARKAASKSRKAAAKTRMPASPKRQGREIGRPKPAALARPRRQLRDDDTIPGAPSSLNFAAKASAAESGHQMYHQRQKEHTEGGAALTGGDVDSDWNDAYSCGEETPGGDMSTP